MYHTKLAKHPSSAGFLSPSGETAPSAAVKQKKNLGRLQRPIVLKELPLGHVDSNYVLSFEIGQRESGFYSERTESQTE